MTGAAEVVLAYPAGTPRNWKMATEGGGRHSPSTVVWEEEGVLVIVRPDP